MSRIVFYRILFPAEFLIQASTFPENMFYKRNISNKTRPIISQGFLRLLEKKSVFAPNYLVSTLVSH